MSRVHRVTSRSVAVTSRTETEPAWRGETSAGPLRGRLSRSPSRRARRARSTEEHGVTRRSSAERKWSVRKRRKAGRVRARAVRGGRRASNGFISRRALAIFIFQKKTAFLLLHVIFIIRTDNRITHAIHTKKEKKTKKRRKICVRALYYITSIYGRDTYSESRWLG